MNEPAQSVPHFADKYKKRFWRRVNKMAGNECWLWTGGIHEGYGVLQVSKVRFLAHRVSWMIRFGAIPDGLCICHHCDNPPCVNPSHLFLGTRADNNLDKHLKGRMGWRASGNETWYRRHPELSPKGESNGRAKITDEDVREIRRLHESGGTGAEISKMFGLGKTTTRDVIKRRTWKHIT